jgi:hypothetical protein
VVAVGAAESVGAGVPAGFDVRGFSADTEGDSDLADTAAGVFRVQQCLGVAPDAVAVPVELEGGDLVDSVTATLFPDRVSALVD